MKTKEEIKKYCEKHDMQLRIAGCVAGVGLIGLVTFILIKRIKDGDPVIGMGKALCIDPKDIPIREITDLKSDDDITKQIFEDWEAIVAYMCSEEDCGVKFFQYVTPLTDGKKKLATIILETAKK